MYGDDHAIDAACRRRRQSVIVYVVREDVFGNLAPRLRPEVASTAVAFNHVEIVLSPPSDRVSGLFTSAGCVVKSIRHRLSHSPHELATGG
jgi:hypothetical protein